MPFIFSIASFHQTCRNGHGTADQPIDRGGPWRPIELVPLPRQGATFQFTFRRRLAPAFAVQHERTPPIVFVVDDESSRWDLIKRLLQSVGLEARHFTSASEFLRAKRPDAPGCLVLDVRLPDLSGLDLQQELANANVDLPVILSTGHADIA